MATPTLLPLRRLSDFLFPTLQNACGGQYACLQGVKWIVHDSVTNTVCLPVAQQALTLTGQTLQDWPGTSFAASSEQGYALIGCPNGVGVAYLLAQHVTVLGSKYVDQVVVFANDNNQLSLAWHVTETLDEFS